LEPATVAQTGSLLRQAIVLDPECGEAHATLVLWTILQLEQGRAADTDAAIAEAERAAECAVSLDPHDAAALTIAGYVRVQLLNRPDDALAMYERALRLNPHLALAWNFSGLAHACLGNAAEAERRLSRYKALTPNAPLAFFLDTTLVLAALLRRDHAAAVGLGREVAEMNPAFSGACKPYLAALGHLDRREDADVVRRRLLRLEPQFSVRRYLAQTGLAEEADRLHVAEGLRRAGVME
jgi:tetratricopeptide (TPR) repeat protein